MDPSSRKLRLMCSYGGRIVQYPCKKSFLYAGGETRIISIPHKLTVSSLTAHLSSALNISTPFNLKYLLPGDALDSLISVCTDEDLLIMLDEHRHTNLGAPRIRLFIFPAEKRAAAAQLKHPKTESWFVDTLKSAQFMQSQGNGHDGSNSSGGISESESQLMETTSSFGSSSSSGGDAVTGSALDLEDTNNKLKLSTPESVQSDHYVAPAARHQHCGGAVPVAAGRNLVSTDQMVDVSRIPLPQKIVGVDQRVDVSRIPLPPKLQFVPAGASKYVLPNQTSALPVPSYYVMNSQLPQQQIHCGTNQSQAVYVVANGKPYTHPPQSSSIQKTAASNLPMMNPVSYANSGQVAYKAAAGVRLQETMSQVYQPVPMSNPLPIVPPCENLHRAGLLPQINNQAQSVEIAKYVNEPVDNCDRALIYKTQPPPPPFTTLPCHF